MEENHVISVRGESLDFSCFNWFWSKHIYASHILHQQQMWKKQQTYIIHTCSTVLYRSISKWTMPWHYQPSRMSVQDSTAMARAMTSLKQPPSCTVWSGDVGCWVWEASWVSAQIMSEVAAMKKRDAACRCAGPWQKLGKSWTVPYSTPYLMVHHRFSSCQWWFWGIHHFQTGDSTLKWAPWGKRCRKRPPKTWKRPGGKGWFRSDLAGIDLWFDIFNWIAPSYRWIIATRLSKLIILPYFASIFAQFLP